MTREEHISNLELIGCDGWTVTTEAKESLEWAISELKENKGEWIPVSERLPKNDTEVVYQSERGGVGSCHYYNGFNNYPNTDPDCIFTDIVAWIPIPEPYKADMRGE